jgi:hypothetical protein
MRPSLERVDVEEARAVERDAGQNAVVDRTLDNVRVLWIAGRQQQPPAEHHAGDRGTRLGVRAVGRQLERVAEGLVAVAAAQAAGEVGAGGDHVAPSAADRIKQALVAQLGRDVDRGTVEVQLPDGMPGDARRLANGQVILPVPRSEPPLAEQPLPARLDHPGRQLEVAPLAGGPKQLHQCHLDLRVAVDARLPLAAELAVDRLDGAGRDREQPIIPERSVPGDRGLHEVADAVQLMAPLQVGVRAATAEDLDERVDVAVGPLRAGDQVDRLVGGSGERRLRLPAQLPPHRLEPLVRVRVEKRERAIEHEPERFVLTRRVPRRQSEVVEIAGPVELLEPMREGPLPVDAEPLTPEAPRHLAGGDGPQGRDRRARGEDGGSDPGPVCHATRRGPGSRPGSSGAPV